MLYYVSARACLYAFEIYFGPLNIWATAGEYNAILLFLDPGLHEFVSVLISKSLA